MSYELFVILLAVIFSLFILGIGILIVMVLAAKGNGEKGNNNGKSETD